jgi:hypothetical protein
MVLPAANVVAPASRRHVRTGNDFARKERNIQMEEETTIPDPVDDESDVDGCDVEIEDPTPDEELPATEGGVA